MMRPGMQGQMGQGKNVHRNGFFLDFYAFRSLLLTHKIVEN